MIIARIITITGDLGSGKGTVCEYIKNNYAFRVYSTGDVQRKIAERYGMTTLELNKYSETHPEIDDEIDNCFTELAASNEDIIIDSRMAWHFIPQSFKVYLKVDANTAAERIFNAHRGNVENYESVEDAKIKILERKACENTRYMNKYNADCGNMINYDLIADSTNKGPEEVAEVIMNSAEKFFNAKNHN